LYITVLIIQLTKGWSEDQKYILGVSLTSSDYNPQGMAAVWDVEKGTKVEGETDCIYYWREKKMPRFYYLIII
jgi:hypothetical protein